MCSYNHLSQIQGPGRRFGKGEIVVIFFHIFNLKRNASSEIKSPFGSCVISLTCSATKSYLLLAWEEYVVWFSRNESRNVSFTYNNWKKPLSPKRLIDLSTHLLRKLFILPCGLSYPVCLTAGGNVHCSCTSNSI